MPNVVPYLIAAVASPDLMNYSRTLCFCSLVFNLACQLNASICCLIYASCSSKFRAIGRQRFRLLLCCFGVNQRHQTLRAAGSGNPPNRLHADQGSFRANNNETTFGDGDGDGEKSALTGKKNLLHPHADYDHGCKKNSCQNNTSSSTSGFRAGVSYDDRSPGGKVRLLTTSDNTTL